MGFETIFFLPPRGSSNTRSDLEHEAISKKQNKNPTSCTRKGEKSGVGAGGEKGVECNRKTSRVFLEGDGSALSGISRNLSSLDTCQPLCDNWL
ncbi:hypothetical protein BaRGS_00034916 [Batillaria attramentaria]|uniref:Uncharacterized protein n=1 Tax=Batillaria attramentaria TaxID=370345 RepID=A0ABD0JGF6_9CAEN